MALGEVTMAFGAVLFSLPTAMAGTAWLAVLHGLTMAQSVSLYAIIGFSILLMVMLATAMAERAG